MMFPISWTTRNIMPEVVRMFDEPTESGTFTDFKYPEGAGALGHQNGIPYLAFRAKDYWLFYFAGLVWIRVNTDGKEEAMLKAVSTYFDVKVLIDSMVKIEGGTCYVIDNLQRYNRVHYSENAMILVSRDTQFLKTTVEKLGEFWPKMTPVVYFLHPIDGPVGLAIVGKW